MDEYISREAIVKEIKEEIKTCDVKFVEDIQIKKGLKIALKDIKAAKATDVQPVNRWIGVKDRLPETGESVLVYVAINKNLKGFGECKPEIRIGWLDDGDKWALQFSNMDYSEVLYWLPLPELPKDGDTNG